MFWFCWHNNDIYGHSKGFHHNISLHSKFVNAWEWSNRLTHTHTTFSWRKPVRIDFTDQTEYLPFFCLKLILHILHCMSCCIVQNPYALQTIVEVWLFRVFQKWTEKLKWTMSMSHIHWIYIYIVNIMYGFCYNIRYSQGSKNIHCGWRFAIWI